MQIKIIVDNDNIIKLLFNPGEDLNTLNDLLFNNYTHKAILVYGGELRREYFRSDKVKKIMTQLEKAGKAIYLNDEIIDKQTQEYIDKEIGISNDQHILALSKISAVRLLCTNDSDLEKDFKNPKILNKPRGKIYKNNSHNHLLNL